MPSTRRRWVEEGRTWLRAKRAQGTWLDRHGEDAVRLLKRCGNLLGVPPKAVTVEHLWLVIRTFGSAPKTKRAYLAVLGSFLLWLGNPVVQQSGIRRQIPNRAVRTPVVSAEDRDRILSAAQGPERILTGFLGVGRRPVEVRRMLLADLHLDSQPPEYDVRGKGGRGELTHTFVVPQAVSRELEWWLPLRMRWAARARSDTGHLLCRWDRDRLVGVGEAYTRRLLQGAVARAGTRWWPLYAFRRGTATLLRERGADYEDISEVLGHSSAEMTRQYVEPLLRKKRGVAALRLLETSPSGQVS